MGGAGAEQVVASRHQPQARGAVPGRAGASTGTRGPKQAHAHHVLLAMTATVWSPSDLRYGTARGAHLSKLALQSRAQFPICGRALNQNYKHMM